MFTKIDIMHVNDTIAFTHYNTITLIYTKHALSSDDKS